MTPFHALQMNDITGQALSFKQYKGQICLVVNVASQ
jgi:glutathione peroxidase-family protein